MVLKTIQCEFESRQTHHLIDIGNQQYFLVNKIFFEGRFLDGSNPSQEPSVQFICGRRRIGIATWFRPTVLEVQVLSPVPYAAIAQLVEQVFCKHQVGSSSLSGGSIISRLLFSSLLFFWTKLAYSILNFFTFIRQVERRKLYDQSIRTKWTYNIWTTRICM